MKFLHSSGFMNASLANLAKTLNVDYKYTKPDRYDDGKDIFPYIFIDSAEKFDTQIDDIKHKDFYNILTRTNITQDEYDNFRVKCEQMTIKTLREWHDFYLAKYVLLLADVFEQFRKVCFEYYKLDPCHFISTPDLSWSASVYQTYREAPKFTIELMTDSDMYLMIEKGIKGGLSQIGDLRYAKADENDKVEEDGGEQGEECEKDEKDEEDGKDEENGEDDEDGEDDEGGKDEEDDDGEEDAEEEDAEEEDVEEGNTTCDSESTTTTDTDTDTTVKSSATSSSMNNKTTTVTTVVTTVVTTTTTTTTTTTIITTTINNRRKGSTTKWDDTKWDDTNPDESNSKWNESDINENETDSKRDESDINEIETGNNETDNNETKKKQKQILYLDANNLYPTTMFDYSLPYGGFKLENWLCDLPNMGYEYWLQKRTEDDNVGYVLEVDLDYCEERNIIHIHLHLNI